MDNTDPHTWAAAALRATLARCMRALAAQIERTARGDLRLAARLREEVRRAGQV